MRKKKNSEIGVLSQLVKTPSGLIGTIIIALLLITAIFAPILSPYDFSTQNISERLSGPTSEHHLGTDHLGRDLLSRIIYGTRIALKVAIPAVIISLFIGVLLGLIAGYFGGIIDYIIIIILDTIQSLPSIVLALVMLTLLGPSLTNLIVVMGLTLFPGYSRVVRAQVMSARQELYVDAEKALGAKPLRIIAGHILPNVVPAVIILSTMDLPAVITIEAGLSFLGMGVRPPSPSWGVILNDGFSHFRQSPWPIITAGAALAITTFGFTLFGESLRDILDPKMSGMDS
ncbi:MAG: ABC transporter permease [Spirochaetales bacterium]|nr:ABC transporter permease [Spirochaetales bacterium]